jgi:predicted nucleotidyltransferase
MVSMKEIRAVARQIGREFRPRQVILFGSYARGTPTADSDVDLLVIMPFEGHPAYTSAQIRLKVDPRIAMDILVRTPEMVRKRLTMGDCFMQEIVEKGKVLYAADHRGVGGQGRGRLRRKGKRHGKPRQTDANRNR